MKKILEKIFDKKINSISFKQDIVVDGIRYYDNGMTHDVDLCSYEPNYIIEFEDGSKSALSLSELVVEIFNSVNK
jgi:hypothetical protein